MSFRIVTYNIRHCRGIDNQVDLARITGVLKEIYADIVCLQEVDYLNPRSQLAKQAERIAVGLDMHCAYENNLSIGPFTGMGNAILSKKPIYSTWNKHLHSTGERRGVIYAETAVENKQISIFCSHWGLSAEQRERQSAECAELVKNAPSAIVMCGDLNATPEAPEIQSLLQKAVFTSAGSNTELTFTSDRLYAKIDYVLVSQQIQVESASPVHTQASDHLPLIADLQMNS